MSMIPRVSTRKTTIGNIFAGFDDHLRDLEAGSDETTRGICSVKGTSPRSGNSGPVVVFDVPPGPDVLRRGTQNQQRSLREDIFPQPETRRELRFVALYRSLSRISMYVRL